MKLSDLHPHPGNPRKITPDHLRMLKKSLEEFGDLSGVVFNRKTGRLVGGHQRQKAMPSESEVSIDKKYEKPTRTGTTAEGYVLWKGERYPYREVFWDETKEIAANIAANKGAGEFDNKLLADWLLQLDHNNVDLELTMHSQKELEDILAPLGWGKEENPEADVVPELPKEAKTKLGELWVLGNHRLLCGDATKDSDLERLMMGQKAELLLTDPPYGVSYVEKNAAVNGGVVHNAKGKKIDNDSLDVPGMFNLWKAVFEKSKFFSNTASYYCFSPQGGELMMMMQAIHQSEWKLKHTLVWVKQNFVFGRSDYHYQHEPVLYGWKKHGTHKWYGDRKQASVLAFDKAQRNDLHPTTKPVAIIEYLLGNSSKKDDLVVDLFLGSGSTLIACENAGRKCFGTELDPVYCDVILTRYADFTGRDPVRADGAKWSDVKAGKEPAKPVLRKKKT